MSKNIEGQKPKLHRFGVTFIVSLPVLVSLAISTCVILIDVGAVARTRTGLYIQTILTILGVAVLIALGVAGSLSGWNEKKRVEGTLK